MSSEMESGRQNRNKGKGGRRDEWGEKGGERDFVTVRLKAHVRASELNVARYVCRGAGK